MNYASRTLLVPLAALAIGAAAPRAAAIIDGERSGSTSYAEPGTDAATIHHTRSGDSWCRIARRYTGDGSLAMASRIKQANLRLPGVYYFSDFLPVDVDVWIPREYVKSAESRTPTSAVKRGHLRDII